MKLLNAILMVVANLKEQIIVLQTLIMRPFYRFYCQNCNPVF